MNLRHAIAAVLFAATASNAMAYDLLNDWPTSYKTANGYEFGFKGLFQYDVNDFYGDTTNPASGVPFLMDSHTWRREQFNFYGKTPWGADFNVGYDFNSDAWLDDFVRYSSEKAGAFRIGQFKTPVGWGDNISSSATTFLERALPEQATYEGRRIGIDWTYTGIPNWLLYAAYFDGGDLNGDNDGHGPAARVVWNPVNFQPKSGSDEPSNVVHLGIAVSSEHRDSTTNGLGVTSPPSARFRARPEAGLTNTRLVDTGNLVNPGNIDRLGLEGGWIHGPLLLQSEYLRFSADPEGKPSYSGGGWYLNGSWVLTGESRSYKNGLIGNVRPSHSYGAFEIAARYSDVDLNDGPVRGGSEQNWTVGANWYLGQHWKFQTDYIWVSSSKYYGAPLNANADVNPNIFEFRVQAYF